MALRMGSRFRRSLRLLAFAAALASSAYPQGSFNVFTRNYNNQRTGANTSETTLTQTNVTASQFGKLFMLPVDDEVYAGVLYVSDLSIAGGTHNVVYIATMNNTVFAYDADTLGPPLWVQNFNGTGRPLSYFDVGEGNGTCTNYWANVGIVGTPVIDGTSDTMYFVTRTVESGNNVYRLHAINILNGGERANSPQIIQASVSGTGDGGSTVTFNATMENQRTALTLSQGVVYIGFGSYCDVTPYHGWVLAYNATTLAQVGVLMIRRTGARAESGWPAPVRYWMPVATSTTQPATARLTGRRDSANPWSS